MDRIEGTSVPGTDRLVLSELGTASPYLEPSAGMNMANAASRCLAANQHPKVSTLEVVGGYQDCMVELERQDITARLLATYANLTDAVEHGAYGVAILLAKALAGLRFVEQAVYGTGVDYWLGDDDSDETEDFNFVRKTARLEVSGLHSGTTKSFNSRVNEKRKQSQRSDRRMIPAFIVVVDFGKPRAHMERRDVVNA